MPNAAASTLAISSRKAASKESSLGKSNSSKLMSARVFLLVCVEPCASRDACIVEAVAIFLDGRGSSSSSSSSISIGGPRTGDNTLARVCVVNYWYSPSSILVLTRFSCLPRHVLTN